MNETERDPRVDAAWRAASRDEPPAALDDAIRAAARRAVESAPPRARDKHWWYPLAAAATVAVIAVGLLQLTPPEQVAPTIVEEAPRASKQEAASATAVPAPRSNAVAPGAPPPAEAKKEARIDQHPQGAGGTQSAQKPQRQLHAADKLTQMPEEESARNAAATPQPPPAPAPARRSEPFPAAVPDATRRDAAVAAKTQSAPLEAGRIQAQGALAKDAREAPSKSKTAARSVDDWIKLIRQLRSEGRFDEATRELAAFRSAYGESAESLLPADLRALTSAAPAAGAKP